LRSPSNQRWLFAAGAPAAAEAAGFTRRNQRNQDKTVEKTMKAKLLLGPSLGALVLLTLVVPASGATLWTGPTITFTKLNGANPSLAANQDRMTADIWLTRGSSQGLYNASSEAGFAHFLSPAGTQWADGTLANYASLTYHDWNSWAKGVHAGPPSTVGVDAVLHLIPDDTYLSIRFTSWAGAGAGGFSYVRSTMVVPEPSTGLLLVSGLAVVGIFSRHSKR
jgi:hypothetical protein